MSTEGSASTGRGTGRGTGSPLATPRLRELASGGVAPEADGVAADAEGDGRATAAGAVVAAPAATEAGACDLCSEPLGARHGHLVDLSERKLLCACRACAILFDDEEAGGDRYRLVPDRVRFLVDFELSEMDWVALRIPVDLAFFFRSSAAARTMALYPGPMGATESQLSLDHWDAIAGSNPELSEMEPDVEALLVDRTGDRNEGWIVPIDACYELVGLFRTRWKGLSGGTEVWKAIDAFFEDLGRRAGVDVSRDG